MKNLYQAQLLEHYQNPRNKGRLPGATFSSRKHNPSCGDAVSIEGIIEDGVVKKMMFEGVGCVISQATASMLSDKVVGMTLDEVLSLDAAAIQQLIGMQLGPTRLKCALLPLMALQEGIKDGF